MGLYDTIILNCPDCGKEYGAQSKSGPCLLEEYRLNETPMTVLEDVNRHAPFTCKKCSCKFKVDIETIVTLKGIIKII